MGGAPRYYEIVYNSDTSDLQSKKEKLIYYKKNSKYEIPTNLRYNSEEYKKLKFSGRIINENCGSTEQGNTELIFQTDTFGFRENRDELYNETDIVLLGDSFTMSVCVNKPYDLKSNLEKKFPQKKILNLGKHGSDYPDQLKNLITFTEKTKFNKLIWFFYEGNDYETKLINDDLEKILLNKAKKNNFFLNSSETSNFNYKIEKKFKITTLYKMKVYISELIAGFSTLITYFKTYPTLLDYKNYELTLEASKVFLDQKQIKEKYLYYIPSWQKLTLYKIKESEYLKNHPKLAQFKTLKNMVKVAAEKNGYTFVDGDKFFFNSQNPLNVFYYEINTHFNINGYKLLSESLGNIIK